MYFEVKYQPKIFIQIYNTTQMIEIDRNEKILKVKLFMMVEMDKHKHYC